MAESVIYVGPQFRDSVLRTFKFYRDGMPAECAKDPVYKHLFVVPEKLDEARQQIAVKGTPLNLYYQRAIKEHNKKKEG